MKLYAKLAALSILLSTNCTPSAPSTEAASSTPSQLRDTLISRPQRQQPTVDTLRLVNDKVVMQLFAALAYRRVITSLHHPAQKVELTSSADGSPHPDSLLTYVAGRNSFTFLKSGLADTSAGLVRCRLVAAPTHLPASLQLGMQKAELALMLNQKIITTNVVMVTEQEGYQQFYFLFKNGTLAEVQFESTYLG